MKDLELLQENIIDFADGQIDEKLKEKLSAIIETDPKCKAYYKSFLELYQAAKAELTPEASPSFYARLNQRIETYESEKVTLSDLWSIFSGKARPALASFSVIAAIAIGYFMGSGLTTTTVYANGSDTTDITEYYGIGQFELSAEMALPDIYNEILIEEDSNE